MVRPRPDGRQAARAIRLSMADAGIKATTVDYVNAHAAGTVLGDAAEARAIRTALGPRGATVPVSGTKGYYGHPLGASGAIEAVICCLAIARGWAPGTVNLRVPDPQVLEHLPGLMADPLAAEISHSRVAIVRARRDQCGAHIHAPVRPARTGLECELGRAEQRQIRAGGTVR